MRAKVKSLILGSAIPGLPVGKIDPLGFVQDRGLVGEPVTGRLVRALGLRGRGACLQETEWVITSEAGCQATCLLGQLAWSSGSMCRCISSFGGITAEGSPGGRLGRGHPLVRGGSWGWRRL